MARNRNKKPRRDKQPSFDESLSSRPGKHPRRGVESPQPTKTPASRNLEDFYQSSPKWSFALLDLVGPFGWIHLTHADLDALLAALKAFERMTWHEILTEGGRNHHLIDVADCSKKARDRLRALKHDDQEQLLSLRIGSLPRIIGVLDRGIMRILWWDPEHQACPSHLRNT